MIWSYDYEKKENSMENKTDMFCYRISIIRMNLLFYKKMKSDVSIFLWVLFNWTSGSHARKS